MTVSQGMVADASNPSTQQAKAGLPQFKAILSPEKQNKASGFEVQTSIKHPLTKEL